MRVCVYAHKRVRDLRHKVMGRDAFIIRDRGWAGCWKSQEHLLVDMLHFGRVGKQPGNNPPSMWILSASCQHDDQRDRGREAWLSYPVLQGFFLPKPSILALRLPSKEGAGGSKAGVKAEGELEHVSLFLFLSPLLAIINRKIFLKDPLMPSPNVKCDIFLADGLLCEGILCPPSMPAGSQFAAVAKVNTLSIKHHSPRVA